MNQEITNVLNKMIQAGFEAYIVGGFVRDFLLGKESYDIDIATNASLEELKKIYQENSISVYYTCLSFHKENYYFEITPYRIDGPYEKGRYPLYTKPASSIKVDSKRRDFTMNSIYMDTNQNLSCFTQGIKDIKKKTIRMIGDPDQRTKEDPLRILRALRFSITMDFKIEKSLQKAIVKNKELIRSLSYARKKEVLEEMLEVSPFKTIEIIKKYDLFDVLEIPKNIVPTHNKWGFYVQLPFSSYPLRKQESKILYSLKLLLESPLGDMDLFYATEDELQTVCEIKQLDFLINKQKRENLPIHRVEDLALDLEFLKAKKLPITEIKSNLIKEIIYNYLPNTEESLLAFIKENYTK